MLVSASAINQLKADHAFSLHVRKVGSYKPNMREFPPELITATPASPDSPHVPTILVDSRSACMSEAGELIAAGISPSALVELGQVVGHAGDLEPTKVDVVKALRSTGRSLFKCVGVGGMDVAITELVVRLAEERDVGTVVEF